MSFKESCKTLSLTQVKMPSSSSSNGITETASQKKNTKGMGELQLTISEKVNTRNHQKH